MKYYEPTLAQQEIYLDLISLPKEKLGYIIMANSVMIDGDFDPVIFKKAADFVKSQSDNFQIRFKIIEDELKIYFADIEEYNIEVFDYSKEVNPLEKINREALDIAFDRHYEIEDNKLFSEAIYILPNNKFALVLYINHIIIDAYGYSMYLKAISTKYHNLLLNEEKEIEFTSFKDEIESDKEYVKSDQYNKDLDYWKENLKSFPTPVKFIPVDIFTSTLKRLTVKLEMKELLNIQNTLRNNKLSIHTYYLSIFNLLLKKIYGNSDIMTCITLLNRNFISAKKDFGLYTTAVPIRVKMEEDFTLLDLINQTRKTTKAAKNHQKTPLTAINKIINKDNFSNNRWKEISFTSRIADFNLNFGNSEVQGSINHNAKEANMALLLEVDTYNISNEVIIRITYNESLFLKESVEQILDLYKNLLIEGCKDLAKPLKNLVDSSNNSIIKNKPNIIFENTDIEKMFLIKHSLDSNFLVVNDKENILPNHLIGNIVISTKKLIETEFLGYYKTANTIVVKEHKNNIKIFKNEFILLRQLSEKILSIPEIKDVDFTFEKHFTLTVTTFLLKKEIKAILRKLLPSKLRPKTIQIV